MTSAVVFMDSIGSVGARERSIRGQVLYERRLDTLSQERDLRAAEAAQAQTRFNLALDEVSAMQSRLLASEESRREAETGIGVIQNTLRRTIAERDAARAEAETVRLSMAEETGSAQTTASRAAETGAALDVLAEALTKAAALRDVADTKAAQAEAEVETALLERRLLEERNDDIFRRLEQAVSVSMEPLDRMFREVGLEPDEVIGVVRSGYAGQGGPLMPIAYSTKGDEPSVEELRAKEILGRLDEMNLYRLAIEKTPFAMPVQSAFRFTSGFGYRTDPFGEGHRMHTGVDLSGAAGTPILVTADGVVTGAGWKSGYGQHVTIRHGFGLETLYGHLSRIHVGVGQRVSRGERNGDMGSTGRSTGTHLHYEVHVSGRPVNPMTYIKAARDVF